MSEAIVQTSDDNRYHKRNHHQYLWHDGIDDHRLQDLQSYILEPIRLIIIKGSIEKLCELNRLMFRKVGIDNQNEEARIEKLCHEDLVGD